jgi:two-component system, sensor histidine kinase RpfC
MRATHERPTILVVDDEATLRKAIKRLLEHAGYRVLTAMGSEDSVAQVETEQVDAVLCDLHLAGESGTDVCERLWAADATLAGRTLIMSGELASAELDRLIERAGLPPILKPFTAAELVLALTPICPPPAGSDDLRHAS